jgi:anti-sigma factor RsiW
MLSCRSIDPLVTPFIDGELPDPDRREVERHLLACPPCHSRIAAERAVRELLRDRKRALDGPCAPGTLRATCAGFAHALPPGDPRAAQAAGGAVRPLVRRLAPLAIAATVVLVASGEIVYRLTDSSSRVLAAELAADHMKCFALNGVLHTHDTPSSVERSMLSGFGWKMQLPSDAAAGEAGLELVGSRPCFYGEGKIAHIMYSHAGHPVSLFMLPKSARAAEVVEALGHEAAIWCSRDRTFVLVARGPREEVSRMASQVQASLR